MESANLFVNILHHPRDGGVIPERVGIRGWPHKVWPWPLQFSGMAKDSWLNCPQKQSREASRQNWPAAPRAFSRPEGTGASGVCEIRELSLRPVFRQSLHLSP